MPPHGLWQRCVLLSRQPFAVEVNTIEARFESRAMASTGPNHVRLVGPGRADSKCNGVNGAKGVWIEREGEKVVKGASYDTALPPYAKDFGTTPKLVNGVWMNENYRVVCFFWRQINSSDAQFVVSYRPSQPGAAAVTAIEIRLRLAVLSSPPILSLFANPSSALPRAPHRPPCPHPPSPPTSPAVLAHLT
ncbi:hypothetical protein THAOC_05630 [Thalassiosira oceanica]|uniref:Uncharacterized protein n=1 Tax=Thalassiosira oceanica TaxID=159749 RepID=K0TGN7_THAOC|nr:hypothetical protein THAOC_05630 [Thalassiosira oceanica]|eukprot:EJK72801.1 hypothetical protein THAOC_05630 [Thalassiosira oceanica]